MVEHRPLEQNSWGHGFKSRRVLGSFLSLSLSSVSLIRSLEEVLPYWNSLTKKWMLSWAAWEETIIICTDLARKTNLPPPWWILVDFFIYWAPGFISHMHTLHLHNAVKQVIFNGDLTSENFAGTRIWARDLPTQISFIAAAPTLQAVGLLVLFVHW